MAREYFHELMCMRCCEWSLKAQEQFGVAIGLWLAAFFKAESAGVPMPEYFGQEHANALVYARRRARSTCTRLWPVRSTTGTGRGAGGRRGSGDHRRREIADVHAWTVTAIAAALAFPDKAVRYSAAIAIANAGPRQPFPESGVAVQNLAEALTPRAQEVAGSTTEQWTAEMADNYALRAAQAMLKLAIGRNPVIDLSLAQPALVGATKATRQEIQTLAGQVWPTSTTPTLSGLLRRWRSTRPMNERACRGL